MRWRILSGVALLVAGCGGAPVNAPDSSASARPTGGASSMPAVGGAPSRKPTIVQRRGGGYYKDDGPGDEIPDNLDDIPDAEPRAEPLHRFANRPYSVLGRSYVPDTSLRAFRQRGIASWYGKKFHGQKTSIGEPYDMFSMTAAHPTMAIPSYARVTNPANGKSVVVRVTDRGPFHADRIIDLSYAAAYRLGYVANGSTLVEVESVLPGDATALTYAQVLPPQPANQGPTVQEGPDDIERLLARTTNDERVPLAAPPAVSSSEPAKGVFLQLGAFASADNAESLRSHLARELDWLTEMMRVVPGAGMHRVQLGPYGSRADAERVAERIRLALGYKPGFVTR